MKIRCCHYLTKRTKDKLIRLSLELKRTQTGLVEEAVLDLYQKLLPKKK